MPVFSFPVLWPPPVNGIAQPAHYEGIGVDDIGKLKKAIALYGPQSHYVKELLNEPARHYNNFAPEDWKVLCRALLREPEYLQPLMWFTDLCAERARLNAQSNNSRLQVISYTMLTGTGQYTDPMAQAQAPKEIHEQLRQIGTEAWERVRPAGEHYGSWTKVSQKTNEPYVEFPSRLKLTLERTVVREEARQQLLKLLAYENANDDCKRALLPIKETGDVNTFLKACRDITSEYRKMQMLAETMATTWHTLQATPNKLKCYDCGQTGHIKRNCKKGNENNKKGPGICPKCKKRKALGS
ncbi:hypothetical protein STEG23_020413 [Scotinomys teguina]